MNSLAYDDADDALAHELASRAASGAFTLFSGSPAPELARLDPSLTLAEWALFEPEALVQAYALRAAAGAHVALCDLGAPLSAVEKDTGLDAVSALDALVRAAKRAGFRYVAAVVHGDEDAVPVAAVSAVSGVHLLVLEGVSDLSPALHDAWSRPVAHALDACGGVPKIYDSLDCSEGAPLVPQSSETIDMFSETNVVSGCVVPASDLGAAAVARLFCAGRDMREA